MDTTSDTDSHLLQQFCHGDQGAFALLVSRHYSLVLAACRRQVRSGDEVDCAQAVFLVLARRPQAAAKAPVLAAWLLRTAMLVCKQSRRAVERRRLVALSADHAVPETSTSTEEENGPETAVAQLDVCLQTLPERQRNVVILHYLRGQAPDEIAASLRITRNNVYQLLHRGLATLRDQLTRRGITITGSGLIAIFASESQASTTPAALIPIVTQVTTPTTEALATKTLKVLTMMTWAKPVAGAAALLLTIASLTMTRAAEQGSTPVPMPHPSPVVEVAPPSTSKTIITQAEDGVALSTLVALHASRHLELKFLRINEGRIYLTPAQSRLVGIDAATTAEVEGIYAKSISGLRAALAEHPPTVTREGKNTVVVTVNGISKLRSRCRQAIEQGLAALAMAGKLSRDQATFLACLDLANERGDGFLAHFLNSDAWIRHPSSDDPVEGMLNGNQFDTRLPANTQLSIRLEGDDESSRSARIEWTLGNDDFSDGVPAKAMSTITKIFLAAAGLPEFGTFEQAAHPPLRPTLKFTPRSNQDQVPLSDLLSTSGVTLPIGFLKFQQGSFAVSSTMQTICKLDARRSAAVALAFTAIYTDFRRHLAAHPPVVALSGNNIAKLEFNDLTEVLAPLTDATKHALDGLVSGPDETRLSPIQRDYLVQCADSTMKRFCWDYGPNGTFTVTVERNVDQMELLWAKIFGQKAPSKWNFTYSGEDNLGQCQVKRSYKQGTVKDEFRAFFNFVPFLADEALPSIPPAGMQKANF